MSEQQYSGDSNGRNAGVSGREKGRKSAFFDALDPFETLSTTPEPAAAPTPTPSTATASVTGDRHLPPSFYRVFSEIPKEFEGVARLRDMADKINRLPRPDREFVRELYRGLAHNMIELDASDMDIGGRACNNQIWYRVGGFKRPYEDMGEFSQDETDAILLNQLTTFQQDHLLENYSVDFGYTLKLEDREQRYRTTVYFDNQALAVCKRLLAGEAWPLKSYKFHPLIERGLMFRHVRDGVTLLTGVTGSGKSTTLDAIIEANNQDVEGHILLIAQPIEYMHTSKKCIIRHREVGTDVKSFYDGIVQGLRQDPDIVVVGEMRDRITISAALEMADTGHKVFSTLHTASAIETIERIIAEYPPVEQHRVRHRLADVLRCIISQKLLPGLRGGRVLAKEVLWMTSSARAAIKNGNDNEIYQMIWEGGQKGMITLEQDLYRLARRGEIAPDVAVNYANNKRRLLQLMQ